MSNIDQKKMDQVSGGAIPKHNDCNADSGIGEIAPIVGAVPKHNGCKDDSSSVTDVNAKVINGGADTLSVNADESALEAAAPVASDITLESKSPKWRKLEAENPKHR